MRSKLKDVDTSEICKLFAHKLLEENFDPSAGMTIDDVRINHWYEALQEIGRVDPGHALASDCYYTWKTTRLKALALSPEVSALLTELKHKYKLLLLTNGDAQTQREKLEAVACEGFFSAVVVGGEHAEQKPAVSIFAHCFKLLGVKPHHCIMVGDSLDTDIQGGLNAGVRATVWINKSRDTLPENSVTPDYTVTSVLDLPNVLAKLK